jgi:hypothetical protein
VHRPFRGLLSVHSRYGLHTRAVTVYRDTLSEGFSHFVTSIAAPVASGWSVSPGGACTHWKAPPSHGARQKRSFALLVLRTGDHTCAAGTRIRIAKGTGIEDGQKKPWEGAQAGLHSR